MRDLQSAPAFASGGLSGRYPADERAEAARATKRGGLPHSMCVRHRRLLVAGAGAWRSALVSSFVVTVLDPVRRVTSVCVLDRTACATRSTGNW